MNLEVVEAYPMEVDNTFSMHVYLPDIDLDVRGIHVFYRKRWMFLLPNKANWDEEQKKNISFPCISFVKPANRQAFTNALYQKGTAYMQEKMCEIMEKARKKLAKKTKVKRQPKKEKTKTT